MVVWTGYGFIAFILGTGLPLLFLGVCNGLGIYDGFYLPLGSGLILAGACCWGLGRSLNARELPKRFGPDVPDPVVREEPRQIHTLYFIRIEYCGIIFAVFGLYLLITLIRQGDIR